MERENSQFFSEVYSNKISRFSDDYPVSGHKNSNIVNSIWLNIDEKKLASAFVGLTDVKRFAHYTMIKDIEQIKVHTTSILEGLTSDK